ncbi:ACT domain-containing protein [Acidithiobacillus montserratensis]|uniref:ACT domain-containing protein n=1 Tax=Acidithiobacillus montserratensis TaxID=2729135 RepID=A0ACD5HIV8_9PROT|nr:ACT domain-containing protein [Acidithiobacillus montserratensis]MBU2748218.1 ACT domain-containing protein [Acidithiobacillus montserratensis]
MESLENEPLPEQVIILIVRDQPGTLFQISAVFSNRGISMSSIQLHEESIPCNGKRCTRLIIRFFGEESRKKIIIRLLSRLDCVLESDDSG